MKRKYEPRDTGLKHLIRGGKITRVQYDIGLLYGEYYRMSDLGEKPSIRSCLDVLDRVSGGGGGGLPPALSWNEAQWSAWARQELETARSYLSVSMVDVCDLICGRQFMPWEIEPTQAVYTEYVVSLSNALQVLHERRWGRQRLAA